MKRPTTAYIAPVVEVLLLEPQSPIATSGDIENYNNEDYNWGE